MDGKIFGKKFMQSEIAGFGFGLPVATAYALLLIAFDQALLGSVLIFVGMVAVVVVGMVAVPMNLAISHSIGRRIDRFNAREMEPEEGFALYKTLMALPKRHGIYIFSRIAMGAVICGSYMKFWLKLDTVQAIVAVLLAMYGAYLAGLVAYMVVAALVRPIARTLIKERYVPEEEITQRRHFSLGIVQKLVLFIIVPILFTNGSLVLAVISSIAGDLPRSAILMKTIGIVVVNVVSLSASVLFTIRIVTRPLGDLEKSLGVFAYNTGNLTREIPTDLSDDFAYISYLMNRALAGFKEMIQKVSRSGEMINESTQELSTSAGEISSTANEQAAAVNEIVATMEDSDELAKEIAGRIQEVTRIAQGTKDAVENGFKIIQDTLAKMEEIRESSDGMQSGIKFLAEKIESIWEIVNIINGIADQTKIIAFNAELEASAAGDAGNNFQIVATEIRRLADNTTASTGEIRNRINEIQSSSDTLILSSENSTRNVSTGYELSLNLKQVFADIQDSAELSVTSATKIDTSIGQQVSAFEQILHTLKIISGGVNQFVDSTKMTSKSTVMLKEMAEELKLIVDNYTV